MGLNLKTPLSLSLFANLRYLRSQCLLFEIASSSPPLYSSARRTLLCTRMSKYGGVLSSPAVIRYQSPLENN